MKRFLGILALSCILAFAQDEESLLSRAVAKLIDENRAMRMELSVLRTHLESMSQLEERIELLEHNSSRQQKYNESLAALHKDIATLQKQMGSLQKEEVSEVVMPLQEPVVLKDRYAKVSAELLNVRNAPSFEGRVQFSLGKNEKVRVGESVDSWTRVYGRDWAGWVAKEWLIFEEEQ